MDRDTEKLEMRRKIFKRLKQEKLFSRFCMVIASTFYLDDQPRTKKEQYLAMVTDGTLDYKLIRRIVREWGTNPHCPKLPKII